MDKHVFVLRVLNFLKKIIQLNISNHQSTSFNYFFKARIDNLHPINKD